MYQIKLHKEMIFSKNIHVINARIPENKNWHNIIVSKFLRRIKTNTRKEDINKNEINKYKSRGWEYFFNFICKLENSKK